MGSEELKDLIEDLQKLCYYCEGAMICSRGGKYLHNFSFTIQDQLMQMITEIEYHIENEGENKND